MKTMFKLGMLSLATGMLLLVTACEQESIVDQQAEDLRFDTTETRSNSGPRASGHGTITLADGTTRQFSFHAREKNNGTIQGSGVLVYTAGQLNIHFDIDCLNIDGTLAIMSGTVTKDLTNPEREGYDIWFRAQDNGEGNNADPDGLSLAFVVENLEDCSFDYGLNLLDVEGGNIQVNE